MTCYLGPSEMTSIISRDIWRRTVLWGTLYSIHLMHVYEPLRAAANRAETDVTFRPTQCLSRSCRDHGISGSATLDPWVEVLVL